MIIMIMMMMMIMMIIMIMMITMIVMMAMMMMMMTMMMTSVKSVKSGSAVSSCSSGRITTSFINDQETGGVRNYKILSLTNRLVQFSQFHLQLLPVFFDTHLKSF